MHDSSQDRISSTRIVVVYTLFGALWILFSDMIAGRLTGNPELMQRISVLKGLAFVLITAFLLYHLINRHLRRISAVNYRLQASMEQSSFFRSLIEYTRDPFYVLSPDEGYRMVYANRAACEHFEMDLEQLQAMSIPDWDPAFDMSNVDAMHQRMQEGKPVRFETMHKVASGRLIPVEVTASRLVHDGRGYNCGYFYDITERKAMDEALKESEARYRLLTLEFQALLDSIPDGLTLLSPDLTVLWANPASARATALEPAEMIGRHCYEVRSGSGTPCETCIVRDTFDTGEERETVIVSSNIGRTIELRSVPVRDEEGKVVKVIEIGRDITDQVAAEAERLELERKLLHAHKLESLGILAGGIAHDFNNILTGIMGNLSILRMLPPEEQKFLARIAKCEKAVLQATGLTSQLLTFAKGGDPVKKPTDLRHVIENTVSFALTGSSVAAEVTIGDELWPVEADEGQIGQVINNLLINAAQAMPRGGLVLVDVTNRLLGRSESASLKEGRYIRIAVSDQGTGIAPEHLEKIFDPYFTTKETGTGIGLTSVYSIVRKHGGDILVSSMLGKGTTFEVYLPAGLERAIHGEDTVYRAIRVGKGTVLVMDDEDYIRDTVGEMLSLLGYDFEMSTCGEELVQRYREKALQGHAADAVILDLTIKGGMGGLDAAKEILKFDPEARLIVASGYSTNPVVANYRNYGFAAALAKPYRVEDISIELAKVLGQ